MDAFGSHRKCNLFGCIVPCGSSVVGERKQYRHGLTCDVLRGELGCKRRAGLIAATTEGRQSPGRDCLLICDRVALLGACQVMDNRITGSGEPDFDRMRTDDCQLAKAGPPGCEPASAVESGTPTFCRM